MQEGIQVRTASHYKPAWLYCVISILHMLAHNGIFCKCALQHCRPAAVILRSACNQWRIAIKVWLAASHRILYQGERAVIISKECTTIGPVHAPAGGGGGEMEIAACTGPHLQAFHVQHGSSLSLKRWSTRLWESSSQVKLIDYVNTDQQPCWQLG